MNDGDRSHAGKLDRPVTEDELRAIVAASEHLALTIPGSRPLLDQITEVTKIALINLKQAIGVLPPDDQRPHPLRPVIPRPSRTPPMWANNPGHTRRTTYPPTRRVK
ncbi:hypothetical protein [Rhodococcus spongiicola]|uniref:Uncharacterized protein n=1 Tax=Rhodococcus spongiicola TaxID=2487352 RepID=A0A438B5I0_9NOCA|nr:hypothetical protein [Rhodococcus spongiicola]RVW06243.1 hypothetical protein EF834_01955 [Rhodococcus spongiicola]